MWGAPLLVPRLRPELDRAFLWTILSEGSDVRIVSGVPALSANFLDFRSKSKKLALFALLANEQPFER